MKKLFYSVLALISFGFSIDSNAQCTPDASYTDLITNPPGSTVSNDTVWLPTVTGPGYSSVFYLNIPSDVPYNGTTVAVNTFKLESLTGLPDGLDKQCSAGSNCEYAGGQAGCIEIFGDVTPSVPNGATYILDIQFSASITFNGIDVPLNNDAVNQIIGTTYVFAIKTGGTVGVEEMGFSSDVTLFPNPSKGQSTLEFDAKNESDLTVSILDAQGRIINWFNANTVEGKNTIDINTSGLASGVYQVVLSNSKGTHLTKLIVE